MSLEDLEKEIYGFKKAGPPREPQKIPRQPARKIDEVAESWGELEKKDQKKGGYFLKAVIGISLAVIAFGVFLIFQYLGDSSGPQIKIEAVTPPAVRAGVPFEAIINVSNQSSIVLQNASLGLTLPPGLVSSGRGETGGEIRELLGDIGVGGITRRSFTLIAIEDDDRGVKRINVNFLYSTGSRERFEQKTVKEVIVEGPAIEAEAKVPERVLSGSAFEIEIRYRNVSDFDFESLALEVIYPQGFEFISASLPPSSLNNYWNLGGLRAGSSGVLKIKGSAAAPGQAYFSVPAAISAEINGQKFVVSKTNLSFSIAPSPIELSVVVNNNPDYVARISDRLSYAIGYQNQSGIALADAVIRAKLTGELFDIATLQTRAQIDSLTNTLTWNASNISELRLLQPAASGVVSFDIRLLPNFPIKRLNDKNYLLKLEVTMDSPTVPYYLEAAKTSAAAASEIKVSGYISVDAQAFYRDAASGVLNLGAMPPKVNELTQYTIHWVIKNYATDVKDVELRAFLQSGVSLTGIVKSNIDSVPLYNERTQEVVWRIERILAAKGVINEPIEAIFQIQAVPNATQVGQYQPLLSETRIKAVDEFTGLQLENFDTVLTTSLPDDVTVGQGGGRVVQ
jgi:hypothetical protein